VPLGDDGCYGCEGVTTGIHWQDDVDFSADSVLADLFHGRLDQSVGHYTMSLLMLDCCVEGYPRAARSCGAMLGVCTCCSIIAASHGAVSLTPCECAHSPRGTAASAVVN
jgi:hypothetical protein